jgi:hypothetical protein
VNRVRSAAADVDQLDMPADVAARDRLAQVLAEIAAVDPSRHGHTGPDTPQAQAAYARRNRLIWTALALSYEAGVPAGVGHDPTDPRPVVVYLELPSAGQVSWHLPAYAGEWDGHSTAEKYQRVADFAATTVDPAAVR